MKQKRFCLATCNENEASLDGNPAASSGVPNFGALLAGLPNWAPTASRRTPSRLALITC